MMLITMMVMTVVMVKAAAITVVVIMSEDGEEEYRLRMPVLSSLPSFSPFRLLPCRIDHLHPPGAIRATHVGLHGRAGYGALSTPRLLGALETRAP
jgi:hypothetical protein